MILRILYNKLRSKVYVFGDSHARVFTYINRRYFLSKIFDVTVVGGATAMGIVNPNSKTDCLMIFKKKISELPKNAKLIFLLGEVDTGFVIWYRSNKYGLTVESQFKESLGNYLSFINSLKMDGFAKISIMSAPLPTIIDNQERYGEIAGLRKEISVDQKARTDLTISYNHELRVFCHTNGHKFIDMDKYLLGNNGIINSKFLNKNTLDHHCDDYEYSKVIIRELKRVRLIRWAISRKIL